MRKIIALAVFFAGCSVVPTGISDIHWKQFIYGNPRAEPDFSGIHGPEHGTLPISQVQVLIPKPPISE